MKKLWLPPKRAKKVTLKVDVTKDTLDGFNLLREFMVQQLGNDAEAEASVDMGDIVTRALKPWFESGEFTAWLESRKPKPEVTKMLRTG